MTSKEFEKGRKLIVTRYMGVGVDYKKVNQVNEVISELMNGS